MVTENPLALFDGAGVRGVQNGAGIFFVLSQANGKNLGGCR